MKNLWFFLLIGLFTSVIFSSGQIENPDTHLRLTQARLLVEEGEYGVPEDTGEDSHGNIAINDAGERFMVYNPGQSLVFGSIYLATTTSDEVNHYYNSAFLSSFLNFIVHSLTAFFLYRISLSLTLNERKSLLVALIFALTSYSFSFAQSTYEHHFEMLFILIAFTLVIEQKIKNYAIIAGLIISLGLVFRTTCILAIPAILILLSSNNKRIKFMISCIPGIAFLLLHNYLRFQDPFESGYGIAWDLAHGDTFKFWSISRVPEALLGFLFSPGKGLLFFSTTAFISILCFRKFFKDHTKIFVSILITIGLFLGLYSLNFAWHGSIWSFGPRYILPILPLIYLLLIKVKINKFIVSILVVGMVSQCLFMTVNYKRDVLEQYVEHTGLKDSNYIFDIKNIPQNTQAKQLINIIPKNLHSELQNYQPAQFWKKEIRTGDNHQVLKNSIEKNSINFWWIRIIHWNSPAWLIVMSFSLVIGSALGLIYIVRTRLKRSEI
jgi:hypothetical protein